MARPFDLPEDRLATTTATGERVKLYPADVKGPLRTARTWVSAALILFFLSLPWVKFHGGPLLLLDIVNRKFSVFGLQFRGDDGPIIFFVLLIFIFTIAVVTSVWGRVWCGWACPQTVFIDGVYRRIERWIEGSAHSRKLLDQSPLSFNKITKKGLKYLLFLVASLVITHSFLAVLVGGDRLIQMVTQSPLHNPGPALLILFSTAFITAEFGIFREQFCIIACPYGRFQSVLQDPQSTVVLYDDTRGEPRRVDRHDTSATGDCINCYRCVQVCPTGVDIRRGLQLECIQCTACIDACNEVMQKINKPKGLIRYDSVANLNKSTSWVQRIRTGIYAIILIGMIGGLVWVLRYRAPFRIEVIRGTVPFQVGMDHMVTNHVRLHIYNRTSNPATFNISLKPQPTDVRLIIPISPTIPAGEQGVVNALIQFPAAKAIPPLQIVIQSTVENKPRAVASGPFRVIAP